MSGPPEYRSHESFASFLQKLSPGAAPGACAHERNAAFGREVLTEEGGLQGQRQRTRPGKRRGLAPTGSLLDQTALRGISI